AGTPIQNDQGPFFSGPYKPTLPLSSLNNHRSAGVWTLEIRNFSQQPIPQGTLAQLNSWTLRLFKSVPGTGLGETVADQTPISFRIFEMDPTSSISHSTWTAVGPASTNMLPPFVSGTPNTPLPQNMSGRVESVAVDPSDPTGNTVYVASASGGIWKS